MGSILYIQEVPPDGGGDTMFANMYQAYETLSEPLRKMLDGLTAIHDGGRLIPGASPARAATCGFPASSIPWCASTLSLGRKLLFVDRGFTTRIAQLARHESDALLEMLFQPHRDAEAVLPVQVGNNSIAFWDNRCAQHQAILDYWPHRRYGHRVTISGDRPFGVAQQPSNAELVAG